MVNWQIQVQILWSETLLNYFYSLVFCGRRLFSLFQSYIVGGFITSFNFWISFECTLGWTSCVTSGRVNKSLELHWATIINAILYLLIFWHPFYVVVFVTFIWKNFKKHIFLWFFDESRQVTLQHMEINIQDHVKSKAHTNALNFNYITSPHSTPRGIYSSTTH